MSNNEICSKFLKSPFYVNKEIVENENIKIENQPFIYESIQLRNQLTKTIPENSDQIIQKMFDDWKAESEQLTNYFKERNRKLTYQPIIRGLANFISIITWINNVLLEDLDDVLNGLGDLKNVPVNLIERITFVMNQPDHYHSFIQLSGLYVEIEKLYYKKKITSSK